MSVATIDLENLKSVPGQLQLVLDGINQLAVAPQKALFDISALSA